MDKYSTDVIISKDSLSPESIEFNMIENGDSIDIKNENIIDITENFVDNTTTIEDNIFILENNNERIPQCTNFVIENSSKHLTNHVSIAGVIDRMEEVIQDSLPIGNATSKIEITEHSLEMENYQVLEDYRNYSEIIVEDRPVNSRPSSESKIPDKIEQHKPVKNIRNEKKVQRNTLDSFVSRIPDKIVKQKEPVRKTQNPKKIKLQSNTLDNFVYGNKGTIDGKINKKTNNGKEPSENFKRLFIRLERTNISDKLLENGKTLFIKLKRINISDSSIETVDKTGSLKIEEMHVKSLNKKDFMITMEPKVTREVTSDKENLSNKTYYQCFYCNKSFPIRHSLVNHIKRMHSKEKKKRKPLLTNYQCYHCGKIVKHKRSILMHIRQWHTQGEELHCAKCPYVTNLKQGLKDHIYRKHVSIDEKPIYKCRLCPLETTYKHTFQKHIRKVHEKKIKIKKCKQCDWEGDVDQMSSHVKHTHSKETYFCDRCSFQSNNKGNLASHQITHIEVKNFSCPKCSYRSNSKSRIKHHIRLHEVPYKKCPNCYKMVKEVSFHSHRRRYHNNRTKKKCPQCEKEFFSLTNHLKTHNEGNTKLKCPECPFMCISKHYLNQHINNRHIKSKVELEKFICYFCNKEINNKNGLIAHIRSVHEDHPCECPFCGKQLKSKFYLSGHLRKMHDEDRWFECALCPKDNIYGTKYKRSLRNHMLQQHDTGNKVISYKCELCPYKTKVAEYFKSHVTRAHEKKSKIKKGNI